MSQLSQTEPQKVVCQLPPLCLSLSDATLPVKLLEDKLKVPCRAVDRAVMVTAKVHVEFAFGPIAQHLISKQGEESIVTHSPTTFDLNSADSIRLESIPPAKPDSRICIFESESHLGCFPFLTPLTPLSAVPYRAIPCHRLERNY